MEEPWGFLSWCSIHQMPNTECFALHNLEDLGISENKKETIEETHVRIQKQHEKNGFCEACDPANKVDTNG